MDEEDEVYGGELPEEVEDADLLETETAKTGEDEAAELEAIKQKMQENEDELAKLRQMQSKIDKELTAGTEQTETTVNREEADARSIHVGNVDYSTTPEELQQLFQACGTVNRVTILTDKYEQPKGFAYIEFLEADAVTTALQLAGTDLHGRAIKVTAKRTNVPGMKKGGKGKGKGGGYYGYGGYGYPMMMPMMMPFPGKGKGGRGRGKGKGKGYSPY